MQQIGTDALSQQMLHGLIGKELRHRIQLTITKAQSIEYHGHRRRSNTDQIPSFSCLSIQPLHQPDFSAHSCHIPR